MEEISPDALRLVQEGAPRFLKAVERAAKQSQRDNTQNAGISLTLDAFYDDPMLLYAALWYAYSQGVPVTFYPRTESCSFPPPAPLM